MMLEGEQAAMPSSSCLVIGVWCNGNTTDSGPVILGSSPSTPTPFDSLSCLSALGDFFMFANDTDFERAMKQGWWSKIKGYFLDMLHSIGLADWIEDDLSDNELRYMLWRSYVNLTEPNARRHVFNEEDTSKPDL